MRILVFLSLSLLVGASEARAICLCAHPPPDLSTATSVVLRGKVVEVSLDETGQSTMLFEVARSWGEAVPRLVVLRRRTGGGGCRTNLWPGLEVALPVRASESHEYYVGVCSGAIPTANSDVLFEPLGPGFEPIDGESSASPAPTLGSSSVTTWIRIYSLLALVLNLGIIAFLRGEDVALGRST